MIKNTTAIEINNDIIKALKESAEDIGYDDDFFKENMMSIVTDMINEILQENINETWAWPVQRSSLYCKNTKEHHMRNTDLTNHCTEELELWKDNDEYLYREWNKTIRTGNMTYIKDAFDEMGFKYTKEQWDYLVDVYEEELAEEEKALQEQADEANKFFLELSNKANW